jgi:hypothetical protein
MLQFKVEHGVRTLSQDEKMLMFGLVNNQMRDNMAVLRKMAGVTSPHGSKKRKVQQHMSNQLSLQTKKESSAIGSKMASKNPGAPGAAKLNLLEKPGS